MFIWDNFSTHVLDPEGQIHPVDFFLILKSGMLSVLLFLNNQGKGNAHQVFQPSHYLRAEAGFTQSCDSSHCF